jgi:surfeit locus 1 family protein
MPSTSRRVLIALLLLCGLGFVRLGVWQLERLRERRAANARAIAAREAAPLVLPEDIGSGDPLDRRVRAAGRYDRSREIVVRGQVLNGLPGVHVVTPLRMEGTDTALLVNRGFVPAPDAVTADTRELEEPGVRQVSGIALALPAGGGQPIDRRGQVTWASLGRDVLADSIPYPVLPFYLLQSPDSSLPGLPRRIAPPALNDGPHLNYAIQWFLFAAMSVAFAVVVVARGDRVPRAPS